jgi:hypothetical protein
MKQWLSAGFLLAALVTVTGCQPAGNSAANAAPGASERPYQPYLDRAQPKLPTLKLWLGDQELEAEVARRPVEIHTGMMFRTNLTDREAMLFVFPTPEPRSFYMRNTSVPLTAAYLAPDGTILELHDLKPFDESSVASQSAQVQYVLEVPQGWFQRHQVGVGAAVRSPYGALSEIDWRTLRPRGAR